MLHIGLTRDEIDRVEHIVARLDSQSDSHWADRREHPRIDFVHPLWLNLPAEAGRPWLHIYSRNLSTGGLSFLSRKIFYVDQHLVISHELKEYCPQLVLCRVCFCRSIEMGIQEIGLSFAVAQKDPRRQRRVPPAWLGLVLQNDYMLRQKFHTGVPA